MPRLRLFIEWTLILACTLAIFGWAHSVRLTSRLDNQLLDFAAARQAQTASEAILIVAIDDRSLAAEGQWPWDRRKVAQLIERIDAAKPRAIVADVLFTEPGNAEADAALAAAVARSGKIALPLAFTQAANRTSGLDPVTQIPELRAGMATGGHAVLEPDADGLVRRLPLWFGDGSNRTPHLQLSVLRWLNGKDPAITNLPEQPVLPLRPSGSYRSVSASSVLRGEVPPAFLAGKVVMIGATAPGLGDNFPVSERVGGRMAGVEIQANLLQALEQGDFIRELGPAGYAPGLVAILLLFLGFWRLRPAQCLVLALVLVALLLAGALLLGFGARIWFPPGAALLAVVIANPLWGWRRLSAVSRFLEAEARELSADDPGSAPHSLGGFDSVAKQVERLGYLVDEVSQRRDFLKRVFEAAPDAMLAFDSAGGLRLSNAPARELFGSVDDGLSFNDLIAASGGDLHETGTELHLPDGRAFIVSAGKSADQGGLQVVVLTDVTAARQAETERKEMLAFLSHDLRSPQVAILGLTGAGENDPELLDRIERHARRALALADNFVELSRLSEARLDLREVELGALLSECVDRAWSEAKTRGAALVWQPDPDTPLWTRADPLILSRVADNLIGNALKYGNERGTVKITAGRSHGEVWLAVRDDGPGLPEARITAPFARFGARGETHESGSGLGLAFVKAAVERLSGRIEWQSEPASGTEFRIYLPAC